MNILQFDVICRLYEIYIFYSIDIKFRTAIGRELFSTVIFSQDFSLWLSEKWVFRSSGK